MYNRCNIISQTSSDQIVCQQNTCLVHTLQLVVAHISKSHSFNAYVKELDQNNDSYRYTN